MVLDKPSVVASCRWVSRLVQLDASKNYKPFKKSWEIFYPLQMDVTDLPQVDLFLASLPA